MKLRSITNAVQRFTRRATWKILDADLRVGLCGFGHEQVTEKANSRPSGWDRNTGHRVRFGLVSLTIPISSVSTIIVELDSVAGFDWPPSAPVAEEERAA